MGFLKRDDDDAQKAAPVPQDVATTDLLTPDGLAKFHRSEAERWWPIIKSAGIKAQ